MVSRLSIASVCVVVLGFVAAGNVQSEQADETSPKVTGQAPEESKPATPRKKPRGRLPNQYGQLGISEQQRTKIYELQSGFNAQIAKLRDQIDLLETQRNTEVRNVLTEDQQKRYDELVAKAKLKREEARKKRAAKTAS